MTTTQTRASTPLGVEPLPHGVHVIDTGFQRPGFDAAYLIVEQGRAAFVDTGTNFAVPHLLGALAFAGLAPAGGGLADRDPCSPRPRGRRRAAAAVAAERAPRRAPAGRAPHDRPERAVRRRTRRLRRRRDGALLRHAGGGAGRARARDPRRPEPAAGGPHPAFHRHAGARAPSPLHLGRAQPRLLHRRHLRAVVSRVRRRGPTLVAAELDAGAVRARAARWLRCDACSASSPSACT